MSADLIPHNRWVNRPAYEAAALRVLRSGHVAQGPEVEEFERELAERFRPGGACAVVSSGTAALYLALSSSPIQDRWALPTYACSALYNAAAIIDDEGSPSISFCDVDSTTFNAVGFHSVYVHTYGAPGRVPDGAVEDFTHAPGATFDGKPCGSLGVLSVISFGATKPLGIGMGGAVLGPADAIAEIRERRDYDKSRRCDAFNFQLGDVYAAVGRERLKRLDEENEWRFETALEYEHSNVVNGCHLDRFLDSVNPAVEGSDGRTHRVWYRYVIRVPDRSKARIKAQAHFTARGIETICPLRKEELLHNRLGLPPRDFPNAEEVARTTLSLPIWPGMSKDQVQRVADALKELP